MNNLSPTAYPKFNRSPSMAKIDRLESDLDNASAARWELEWMEARCMDAVRDELLSLAKEVKINGGNPGVEKAIDYAFDLISDISFDGYAVIDREAMAVSVSLGIEYRKQGVA
jgi:hypothetical protein